MFFSEGDTDFFEIVEVKIVENESVNLPSIETGDVIALIGTMRITSDENVVEGSFTLKLVEFL